MMKFLSFLAFLSYISISHAQVETQDKQPLEQWYQIELVVFANNDEDAASGERWQTPLGLQYPENSIHLKPTVTINSDIEITQDASSMPEPEQSITFPLYNNDSALQSPLPIDDTEQPFTLLPIEQLTLAAAARKIHAQRNIRPLFHGAWRQPIASRDEANSIIITAGDQFDDHFELEGTIKLGLERYLHIETELWLNSFVSNIGLSENPWPVLPKRPEKETTDSHSPSFEQSLMQSNPVMTDAMRQLFGNQYSVDRTLVLRQQRRMRSNELHYLDHPLMGVLVRVSAYERPEPLEEPEEAVDPLLLPDAVENNNSETILSTPLTPTTTDAL